MMKWFYENLTSNLGRWYTPTIPALGRLRWKDCGFKAHLG
jgi:hypothetical protein